MCGLAGFMGGRWPAGEGARPVLTEMIRRIGHRGPDHRGCWFDERRIGLGHARLAIIDLSVAGDQPMLSGSGRYVIVFNGEIYNHLDVRRQLEEAGASFTWRGHSDTETLLAAIETWGLTGALERFAGMFAFALWDRKEQRLILARDRVGEKPLYFGWHGRGRDAVFLFGSELKALVAHPQFDGEINRDALALFLRHNSIPAPYSIYRRVEKLAPGCFLTVSPDEPEPVLHRYWSAAAVAEAAVADPLRIGVDDAVEELERRLLAAVGRQMIGDVPIGAFLSGGIDSSTIVALMQAQSSRPVKTFSIGFHEATYDEAVHARAVARHLGTEHTELYVTSEQALAVISRLPTIYDEPFADASQVPTYLVSQLARQHVTVSLSGDGGDELFGGYNRYHRASALWGSVSKIPRPARAMLGWGATRLSPGAWNSIAAAMRPGQARLSRPRFTGEKLHKTAGILASRSIEEFYHGLVSRWADPAAVVIGGTEPPTLLAGNVPELRGLNAGERMMALDLMTYLPDEIFVKLDRAAMAVSLESRIPFMDHDVIEFAWRMPFDYKVRDGRSKWPLRQILHKHVPQALVDRPKRGFGVPIEAWLRGPLRDWAEALLDERRLEREGYLQPVPIRAMWHAHQSGRVNMEHHLWDILMFQSWLEAQQGCGGMTAGWL
jgi:asparagine synthase (glutamine-hydrolysing)